jgi:hypothetical protein
MIREPAPENLNPCSSNENRYMVTDALREKFPSCTHASHLPTFNPHLTKSRLNAAPRLCETLRWDFPESVSKRDQVELFWTQGK